MNASNPGAREPNAGYERILLFVPMYNCAPQIARVIAQLSPDVRSLVDEVIVVNNLSTDGGETVAIDALDRLPGMKAKVLRNKQNYGLGGSHKVALNYALLNGFDYMIVLHGDDQGSVSDLAPLIRAGAHHETDCLLGARFMRGSRLSGYSAFRTFGNHVFNLLYSLAARRRIYDLGSGLNLYRVAALANRDYLKCADDLTFNYHMILRSSAAGHRIRFFPLEWREDDQVSNVKLVRQTMRVLKIVVDFMFVRSRFLAADHSNCAISEYEAVEISPGSASVVASA